MTLIPGPCCLNCEEKKNTPYPITINQRSGYICNDCYNANIWANKDNQRSHTLLDLLLHTKLFSIKKDLI